MVRNLARYGAGVPEDGVAHFAVLVGSHRSCVPLDEACLAAACQAIPDLDPAVELSRLDELADGVLDRTPDGVIEHLVQRLGFAGDLATYHDAKNSLLPAVLDRRRGIPLTLAVVVIEVGRRVGVTLEGVGMPGHFLLRTTEPTPRYLDVFRGGTVLDPAGCRRVFEELHPAARWDDDFLAVVGGRPILARLLGNLAGAHRRTGDKRGLAWALRLRLELPGATPWDHRELAGVLLSLGRFGDGAAVLEALGTERDSLSAARLRSHLN